MRASQNPSHPACQQSSASRQPTSPPSRSLHHSPAGLGTLPLASGGAQLQQCPRSRGGKAQPQQAAPEHAGTTTPRSWRDGSLAPAAGFIQTQQNELALGDNNEDDNNHLTAPPAQIRAGSHAQGYRICKCLSIKGVSSE